MNPKVERRLKLPSQFSRMLSVAMILGVAAGQVHAAEDMEPEWELEFILGGAWSDNMALVPSGEEQGEIGTLGLRLGHEKETRRIHSDIDVNVGYEHFLRSQVGDQMRGGMNGTVGLRLVPGVLEWNFQENLAQVRQDSLLGDTPDNRETINYFTTGPTLAIALDRKSRLMLDAHYSNEWYSSSDLGSDRVGGLVSLVRDMTDSSLASLTAQAERVWPTDTESGVGYTTRGVYAGYRLSLPRTQWDTDIGYSEVDAGQETTGGLLLRMSFKRQLTPSSTFRFDVERSHSDSGNAVRSEQEVGGVDEPLSPLTPSQDAFRRSGVVVGWDITRRRTSVTLSGAYSKDSFLSRPGLDRWMARYGLLISRLVRRTVALQLAYQGTVERFPGQGNARAEEMTADLALTWDAGRRTRWVLRYGYHNRTGDGPVAGFTENRAGLDLVWSPLNRR